MKQLKLLEILFLTIFVKSNAYVLRPLPVPIEETFVDWSQYNAYKEISQSGAYAFGYDIQDLSTNNVQFKNEMRHPNGTITGSYGHVEPDGNIHITHYVADKFGYRAIIEDSDRIKKHKMYPPSQHIREKDLRFSPEMLAAIESKKLFKVQSPYENRQRPVDNVENIDTLQGNYIDSKRENSKDYFPVLFPSY